MDEKFLKAEELGIKLEIVSGLAIWEAHPVIQHQMDVDRIRNSLQASKKRGQRCGCFHFADIYVNFPDGSMKRPDISIFCEMPKERTEATKSIPEAVVEVVSKGYEAKDLLIAPNFYLSQGVKDVIVFNPATLVVLHVRQDGTKQFVSPHKIQLECGCTCIV
ncbi:MAG: Uma2 family endonuclease [Trueperaceae bacterium]